MELRYAWPDIPIGEESSISDPWFLVWAADGRTWTAFRDRSRAETHAKQLSVGFVIMCAHLPARPANQQ